MAQQTLASEACGALSPFAVLQQLIIAGLLPAECVGIPATVPALNASIRINVVDHFIIASENNTFVLVACQEYNWSLPVVRLRFPYLTKDYSAEYFSTTILRMTFLELKRLTIITLRKRTKQKP